MFVPRHNPPVDPAPSQGIDGYGSAWEKARLDPSAWTAAPCSASSCFPHSCQILVSRVRNLALLRICLVEEKWELPGKSNGTASTN